MKNYEKYSEEIKEYGGCNFCYDFIIPHILKSKRLCSDTDCIACKMRQMLWLFEECEESEEPKTDWSKVKVDTPILVRDSENQEWIRRHFAKYENGSVYTWCEGLTSWTVYRTIEVTEWKYAKLAESEESDGN